jgi:hypothetical protein
MPAIRKYEVEETRLVQVSAGSPVEAFREAEKAFGEPIPNNPWPVQVRVVNLSVREII